MRVSGLHHGTFLGLCADICRIVEYATREQAQQAVNTLSNQNLMGRLVYVREVDPLNPWLRHPFRRPYELREHVTNLFDGRIVRPSHASPDPPRPAQVMKDHQAEAALGALLMEVHLPLVEDAKSSSITFVISFVCMTFPCSRLT